MDQEPLQHWLISRSDTSGGNVRFRMRPPETARIGRSASNSLVLQDPGVSREHAILEWQERDNGTGRWRISDQGSSSGTRVNGVLLHQFQSLSLEPRDRIEIGPVVLEFVERTPEDGASTIHLQTDEGHAHHIEHIEPTSLTTQQLEAVLDASLQIHISATEQAVYECTVKSIAAATGFTEVAFVRPSADGTDLRVLAATGGGTGRRLSRTVVRRARLGPVIITDPRTQGMTMVGTAADMDTGRVICVPVGHNDDFFGLLYLSDSGARGARVETLASLVQSVARVAALALSNLLRTRMAQRLEAEQRAMFDGTLHALIAAIDAKDPYTRGHSTRVAEYATLIAHALGWSNEECERARLCGLVHDIGKIGVSEAILCKPDQLTEEEFRHIAAHPEIGHEILHGIPQMVDLLPGVLEHHERFDGGGYPHGTAGKAISELGRLVCVADALDAMTTSRTYRAARPLANALEEVKRCAGTHFDPDVAAALERVDIAELEHIAGAYVPPAAHHDAPPRVARPFTELKV